MIKKIISTLLCLSMLVMTVPVAFATGDASNLVNVARGKTYSSFNVADQFDDPSPLFDGDFTNLFEVLWDGNVNIGYIIDLGRNYDVEEFILWACPGRQDGRDKIIIEYATDLNGAWTRVYERTEHGSDAFGTQQENSLTINDFGTAVCRYVKLQTYSYAIWSEFEILASMPKLDDTTISGRVITAAFSQNINPATVTATSFKVYADNVQLTLDTDYSVSVNGKNVLVTLARDYYDTEFKIEATTDVKSTNGDALAALATDTVTAPSAVEITAFEISPTGQVTVTVTNNTTTEDKTGVVFAMLVDSNNIVLDSDFGEFTAYKNDEDPATDSVVTPQLSIDTSKAVGACTIKAFIWDSLSTMNVLEGHITQNVGTSGSN